MKMACRLKLMVQLFMVHFLYEQGNATIITKKERDLAMAAPLKKLRNKRIPLPIFSPIPF